MWARSAAALVTVEAPDTTLPSISIATPANGATVEWIVNVTAGVQFSLDGVNIGAEDLVAPSIATPPVRSRSGT